MELPWLDEVEACWALRRMLGRMLCLLPEDELWPRGLTASGLLG